MDHHGDLFRFLSPDRRTPLVTSPQPIEIVGGGLAGLSLGLILRQAGVPTTIYEAGEYPRHRVCGEFISGLDLTLLSRFPLHSTFARARLHRHMTWFHRDRPLGQRLLPTSVHAISRHTLDASLAAAFVAAGGNLVTRSRVDLAERRAGRIFATGRHPRTNSPWLGLKCHVRAFPVADGLEFHLGDGAYVGLCPVEDGWINVCGLFRRRSIDAVRRETALVAYLHACGLDTLARRLGVGEPRPDSTCAVAGFDFESSPHEENDVQLGDAWTVIPPFTGDGMAMAFTSAALAAEPLISWAHNRTSWTATRAQIRQRLRRRFRPRLAWARLLHPFLLNPAGQYSLAAGFRSRLVPIGLLYRLLH